MNSAQKDGSSCFGVKRECVITKNLAHFNVLSGYPPDIMHDLFEGVVPAELGQCLSVLISKKYFSLEHLNKSILGYPYKWSDKTNKPHAIPHTFSKTIRGNAHENWALLRFLPFIIGPLVPEDDKAWQILMALKDVVELLVLQHILRNLLLTWSAKFQSIAKDTKNSFLICSFFPSIITWSIILHSSGSLVLLLVSGPCDLRQSTVILSRSFDIQTASKMFPSR